MMCATPLYKGEVLVANDLAPNPLYACSLEHMGVLKKMADEGHGYPYAAEPGAVPTFGLGNKHHPANRKSIESEKALPPDYAYETIPAWFRTAAYGLGLSTWAVLLSWLAKTLLGGS